MIQWERCGDCYTSNVHKGHYAEARQLDNGWWRVEIIRTSDGLTVSRYDADTLDIAKMTSAELMRHVSLDATPPVIDFRKAFRRQNNGPIMTGVVIRGSDGQETTP